jgi:hypothetical protein
LHPQITWQHADPLPVPTFTGFDLVPASAALFGGNGRRGRTVCLAAAGNRRRAPMPRSLFIICGAAVLAASLAQTAGAVSRKTALAEIEATRRLNMEQAALNKRALPPEPVPAQLPPSAAPTAKVETRAGSTALVPVATLTNPPKDIAIATVRDAGGTVVGAVQRVELASSGAPSRLDVAMLSDQDHLVSLDASRLQYDAQTNEVRMSRRAVRN